MLATVPEGASAQAGAVSAALSEARSRLVCGTGTLVSAQYVGNGLIRVTCRQEDPRQQQSRQPANNSPLNAGLATPTAIGVVGGVVLLGILLGGGDEINTTTTTTAPASEER